MAMIELHLWRDGQPLHVESSWIMALQMIEPRDEGSDAGADRPAVATVVRLGVGMFSEWVRERPDEIIARMAGLVPLGRGTSS